MLISSKDLTDEVVIGGVYKHYKNKSYKVHSLAVHSESLETLVYYECLYENDLGQMWVRPIENFLSTVNVKGTEVKRFDLTEQT